MACRWWCRGAGSPGRSQLFHPSGRIAVPGLAAGALPEVLLGFETAGSAAVAHQRLDRMFERALDPCVVLLVLELLAGHPFAGCDQGGLAFEMAGIPLAGRFGLLLHADDCLEHVQRRRQLVA